MPVSLELASSVLCVVMNRLQNPIGRAAVVNLNYQDHGFDALSMVQLSITGHNSAQKMHIKDTKTSRSECYTCQPK